MQTRPPFSRVSQLRLTIYAYDDIMHPPRTTHPSYLSNNEPALCPSPGAAHIAREVHVHNGVRFPRVILALGVP